LGENHFSAKNGKREKKNGATDSGIGRAHRVSTGVTGATLQLLAFAKMASPNVCGFFFKNFGIVFFK
jgi:hypothetical protein